MSMTGEQFVRSLKKDLFQAEYFKNRPIFTGLTMICLSAVFMILAAMAMSQTSETSAAAERKGTMLVAKHELSAKHSVPPIDLLSHAQLETATFALG